MHEFTKDVYQAIDMHKVKVGAIFVDLTKPFDSVNQALLIRKSMTRYNLEPEYVKILKSYLENSY